MVASSSLRASVPDLLDHRPGAADHDRFLRLGLDIDRAVHLQEAAGPIGLVVLVDDDRGRERQLVARVVQDFSRHGLGDEHALRLIGQVVVG
jgi:hypothetical protein